jgi:DNA repair protein RadC
MTHLDRMIAQHSTILVDLLRSKFEARPIISDWASLLTYMQAHLALLPQEQVRVLFLNTKNHLIADEVHARGTVDECPVHIRNLVHRTLELNATAVILAHNHPSGDPTPSRQDIKITRNLAAAFKPLNITLHDHVVIGGANTVSMRAQGLF